MTYPPPQDPWQPPQHQASKPPFRFTKTRAALIVAPFAAFTLCVGLGAVLDAAGQGEPTKPAASAGARQAVAAPAATTEPPPAPTAAPTTPPPTKAPARTPTKAPTKAPPKVTKKPTTPKTTKPPSTDPRFGTCKEAKAHGYGPYRRGVDPEYAWYQDRDGDGIVCE